MGIDAISYTIGNNFPDASVNERHCDSGAWFLDVEANGNDLVLEWHPKYKVYSLIANREILYCEGPAASAPPPCTDSRPSKFWSVTALMSC